MKIEKVKAAAIGTFDGVHRGHRHVLKMLADYSRDHDMMAMAITFNRHPLALIDAKRTPLELTPLWKKKKLLKELGVMPVVLEFDETLRATTASEWMKQLRVEFGVKALIIGYDTTFGSDGINMSLEDYRQLGKNEGIDIILADEVKGVSSSAIRRSVKEGKMEEAHEMLGRPYSITAKVVDGNKLGRTIGFPTANIDFPKNVALPKPGVYAAIVKLLSDGSKHPAMVNVGQRPTVMRGDDIIVEAHIIDWEGDLYGKDITVRFLKRLRDEIKFDSIEALKKQLQKDREEVIKELSKE